MHRNSLPTGYARLTAWQARVVLAVLVLASGLLVAVTLSPLRCSSADRQRRGKGDVALYRAEVDRLHDGEGYYRAAAAELTARGYPTKSVFNWRTPLPMLLIGRMPTVVLGKALLCALALALLLAAFEVLAREERNVIRRPLGCALLLTGALMPCVLGDLFVMPMLWAGILVALSICAYGLERPRLGVGLGLAAVFFRDLALPYCLLSAGIACWQKRWKELALWLMGLAAWAVFFAIHWQRVSGLITPDARAHAEGWIRLGGAGFVISTAQMNAYLLLLPQWITALYLAAALFGCAGWHTPLGLRCGLTVCLFVSAFAVVGQEFNQYWGSLLAPLLCFGVTRFPASLRDACKAGFAARSSRSRATCRQAAET